MNEQEMYDTVIAKMREQGVKSRNEKGACVYAGTNDTACAVGCLFPRELATRVDKFMVSHGYDSDIYSVLRRFPGHEVKEIITPGTRALARDLQGAHDSVGTGSALNPNAFIQVGKEWDLDTTKAKEWRAEVR